MPGRGGLEHLGDQLGWDRGGSHRLADKGTAEVWDSAHRQAAEAAALGHTRPVLRLVDHAPMPRPPAAFSDFDVELPDLAARYGDPS